LELQNIWPKQRCRWTCGKFCGSVNQKELYERH